MAHQIAGLDIGASAIKLARFDVSFRGLVSASAEVLPWREPDAAEAEKTTETDVLAPPPSRLAATLAQTNIGSNEVYMGFPSQRASSRLLTFPLTDIRKIEPMIGFELEDQLPRPLEETVFGAVPVRLSRSETEMLVASADKERLGEVLEEYAAAALQPRAIYYEPLAYLSLASGMTDALIADIGAERTLFLHLQEGRVAATRALPWGGHRLDSALSQALALDLAEARRGKEEVARLYADAAPTPAAQRASDVLSKALAPLVMGLRQTLQTRRETETFTVYLTGGQSLLTGLHEFLARALGCEVKALPLPAALEAQPDGHRFALAYALALSSAAPRQPKIDFRRGEFSFRGNLSHLRSQARKYVYATVAVVAVAFLSGIVRYVTLRSDEAALDKTLREVTRKITGHEMTDYKTALVAMQQASSPTKSSVPNRSAVDQFASLSKRLPPELDLHASDIDLRPDKVQIKGDTTNFESVDKIVDALKADECFKQVTPGKSRKTSDGTRIEFQVTMDEGCS
jgi:Tfp pilus assembly PilM family ATPase/Tfp pilus assembly protein PilN